MTSLEILHEGLVVPQFTAVTHEARSHTKEMMGLLRGVFVDPNALVIVEEEQKIGKQVPHRAHPDVVLRVVTGSQSTADWGRGEDGELAVIERNGMFSEMTVRDPRGSMTLTIEHRTIPSLDLSRDPFAQHLLDAFRSHLTK